MRFRIAALAAGALKSQLANHLQCTNHVLSHRLVFQAALRGAESSNHFLLRCASECITASHTQRQILADCLYPTAAIDIARRL